MLKLMVVVIVVVWNGVWVWVLVCWLVVPGVSIRPGTMLYGPLILLVVWLWLVGCLRVWVLLSAWLGVGVDCSNLGVRCLHWVEVLLEMWLKGNARGGGEWP
jgi:hypothetical protein